MKLLHKQNNDKKKRNYSSSKYICSSRLLLTLQVMNEVNSGFESRVFCFFS